MNNELNQILGHFKGKFLLDKQIFQDKLFRIKAYVFDWDGVFNNGVKDENGSSSFSEIDAMGTNLLRFNHYLCHTLVPSIAIISGEKNNAAATLAKREHFDAVYFKALHKADALRHFCKWKNLQFHEVAFIFDDVLDFSVAQLCGLRIMLTRECNPLLIEFAVRKELTDYLTHADGGHHGVREISELLTGLSGRYEETISGRMQFNENYQRFLKIRNRPDPVFYTVIDSIITEQPAI